VAQKLNELGTDVSQGKFGADMEVSLTNAGPMTLIIDVD
ncbi:MAG: D-tyrosyl-tRNA(Tyr) deacylase, partial [Actinobacteria bacterium]|nr:D-tyrosyl-tRNA(Tyr) deacylase [Actinomycetota bacterium]